MTCLVCRLAQTVDGLTSVTFERGEMRLRVNHIPARVCPNCGEAYVDEEITVILLRDAEEMYRAGMFDADHEYQGS